MNSKLSIHAFSPIHAKSLIVNNKEVIDKIIVGNNKFGLRQVSNFSVDDIEVVCDFAAKFAVDCFVCVNKLIHNHELAELTEYLKQLAAIGVDGLIFSDLAIPQIVETENLQFKLIYSTETTITNSRFTNFANINGMYGVETAKEITLDEVNEIASEKASHVMVQIHGHMYMYQSIRSMVDNFSQFQNMQIENANLFLYDNERNKSYPLLQNDQGTHLLAASNLTMVHKLNELDLNNIDSLRIDPLLYTPTEYNKIVELYRDALVTIAYDETKYVEEARYYFKQLKEVKPMQKYTTGFFYKKTMF